MNWKKILLGWVVILAISFEQLVFTPALSASPQPETRRQVVMLVVDQITIDDLKANAGPNLKFMLEHGAVALMNTNTAKTRTAEGGYLTLGAGTPAASGSHGGLAFDSEEVYEGSPAANTYLHRTGRKISSEAVVHLLIARLQKDNADLNLKVVPGALGGALSRAGYKTAVLGNADLAGDHHRQVVMIAMDEQGLVTYGHVGSDLRDFSTNGLIPGRTDYEKLFAEYQANLERADLIVIEIGDTTRLNEVAGYATPDVVSRERQRVFQDLDAFLGRIIDSIDPAYSRICLVSPSPSSTAQAEKNTLTPVVFYGAGINPGMITSPTTRRPGLITNTDIAPTILTFFGIKPPVFMTGRPVETIAADNPLETLVSMNHRIVTTFETRPLITKGYVILQIVVIILAMVVMFMRRRAAPNLEPFLLGLMAVPLSLLLIAGVTITSLVLYILAAVLITGLIVVASLRFGFDRGLDPFIFVCLGTTLALLLDVVTGADLIKNSVLGYDPMSGARFYGIGNEYMGILIGAAIVGLTALLQRFPGRRKLLLVFTAVSFALIIYLMAAPQYGTNVGGTIAAVAGFGITFLPLAGVRLTRRSVLIVVLGIGLVLGGFIAFDLQRPLTAQSHIGRTANLIIAGGIDEIGRIIARKASMNLKLIRSTLWSRVFLISLAALVVLFHRPPGVLQRIKSSYPDLAHGFIGVLTGSVVALLVNDSGIVAAATMMIYASATLIYLVIRESNRMIAAAEKGQNQGNLQVKPQSR